MATYNPNSIWGSKKKEYVYVPGKGPQPSSLTGPQATAAAATGAEKPQDKPAEKPPIQQPGGGGESGGDGGKKSIFKGHGLAWFAAGLIIMLGVAAAIVVFIKNRPIPQLTLTLSAPTQTFVGDPFILTVSFSNDSEQTLQDAQLSVLLPAGISFINEPQTQRVAEVNLPDIAAGNTSSTTFDVIATTNPNSVQHLQATMTYSSGNNTANQYEATGQTDIALGSAALGFSFNVPANVFSGQNFPITINYANQSPQDLTDGTFILNYPPALTIVSSSLPLVTGSTNEPGTIAWDLGKVIAGASSSFTVLANISGPANAPYPLNGTLQGSFEGQTYPVATQSTNVTIAQAPLSISIALNGTSSYIAGAGNELNYVLTYTNTSNITFQAPNITAKLTGTMFDFSQLHSDGSFNSISDTITWNAATDPQLASLAPGQSGSVNFELAAKANYPIKLPSDKDFVLKTVATISSPTVPPNTAGGTGTQSIAEMDTKVAGDVTVAAQGFFHDPSGIKNTGPYPPKVNQPTEYTVRWVLANYATDIDNVTVSAYLQSGSTFTGVATSSVASDTPVYDPGTGLVSWTIPHIAATTGVLGQPLEATFQISDTPAVNQVGQIVNLVGQTSLTATDDFTGETLSASDQPITTQLPDDASLDHVDNKTVTQ